MSYKSHFQRFINQAPDELHFAAHSHHFWPDVTREATLQYWDDACRLRDDKWGYVFEHIIPQTQKHIARIIGLNDHTQIVFAPNTHELVTRLLSCFLGNNKLTVLTTDGEFHSFQRQMKRLEEFPQVHVTRLTNQQLLTDRAGWLQTALTQIRSGQFNLVFISQVFFNSGIALTDQEIEQLVLAAPKDTIVVIDGYHGFAALPTKLNAICGRAFYLGGGYKYAMSGEGIGFMVVPPIQNWRPVDTGWFADLAGLQGQAGPQVGYGLGAQAFWGATFDPSGLYRFNACWDLWHSMNLTIESIHEHVHKLQQQFLTELPRASLLREATLLMSGHTWHGHFLTYQFKDQESATKARSQMQYRQVIVDQRAGRLRIGMGLYHEAQDVALLVQKLTAN